MFRNLLTQLTRIATALEVANEINDDALDHCRECDARIAQRDDESMAFHRLNRQIDDARVLARMDQEIKQQKERMEQEQETRAMITENMLAIFKRNPRRYLEAIGMTTVFTQAHEPGRDKEPTNAE